jgi:hypothetical protein
MKRLNLVVLGVSIVWLSGCANDGQVYGMGMVGQKVQGDSKQVTVWNVWSGGDALPLAMKHCRKFKKSADFEKMDGITAVFNCVD